MGLEKGGDDESESYLMIVGGPSKGVDNINSIYESSWQMGCGDSPREPEVEEKINYNKEVQDDVATCIVV